MATTLKSYAATTVTPAQSREHVQDLLEKIGAVGFRWSMTVGAPAEEVLEAGLKFDERVLAFRLKVAYEDEREHRQKMRALYWYLKTKVEAIIFGLVDLEEEFLPYLLTADGRTLWEVQQSSLPALLAGPSNEEKP